MPENLLAIDHGTQSVRALLFDPRGGLLAKSRVPLSYTGEEHGLGEQDPEVFWQAVCRACQELWQQPGVERSSIAAAALTTQRSTVINLDAQGRPLRPAILWFDERRTEGLPPVGGLWGAAFLASGTAGTVAYLQAEAEANWIRTHQPEIWAKTRHYLLLSGFLTQRLVGRYVDSVGCQVAYIPFDYQRKRWAGRFDWKWQAVPMDKSILPELIEPGQPLGEITPAAAEATGLPAGLKLIAAAADKACEVIGAGALAPNLACLSYGTTATINTTHKRYIEPIPLIPPYPAAVPDAYNLEVGITRGFWMVTWFKQEFGQEEQEQAAAQGVETESLFDRLVDSVPPGSDGLVLQPYWAPGIVHPGPEARGAIVGFHGGHTRAHLYRAILEGLAYALRDGAERSARRSGVPITELRVAGGGSQSRAAMQLTADIFGLPAARPHVYEASGLGAAIDAAVGSGIHPNFEAAVAEMTHTGQVFEPNPAAHAVYQQLYQAVYQQLYPRLQPLYRQLKRTGKT